MVHLLCLLLGLLGPAAAETYRVAGLATDGTTDAALEGVRISILDAATRDTLLTDVYTGADGRYTGSFEASVATGSEELPSSSNTYRLAPAYPNPVSAGTALTIPFHYSAEMPIRPAVEVFDLLGRLVEPSTGLPGGVYFYRLRFDDGHVTDSRSFVVQQGGPIDVSLEMRPAAAASFASFRSAALEVVFVLEKPGYDVILATRTLQSDVDNPHDFALLATGSLTAEQRIAALDAAESYIATLDGSDFDAETQAIVAFLQSRPEIAYVEASEDGTIGARFSDGTLLAVVYSAPVDLEAGGKTVPSQAPMPAMPPSSTVSVQQESVQLAPTSTTGTVPSVARYRLLNGVGNHFDTYDARSAVAGMLNGKGYSGLMTSGTLESLRSVQGDGIFYFRTHGGAAFRQLGVDEEFYAMWTASPVLDPADERADALLSDDLLKKRIAYMLFRNTNWTRGIPILPQDKHYGITHRFIDHYMSFAANSIVYLDACDGATWGFVRAAFGRKGASVFVGWDERALFSAMGQTAQFIFDRLLGSNTFNPETPRQRPFNYMALPNDPKFGTGKTYGHSAGTTSGGGPISATIGFYPLRDDFGFLAPSIKRMEVDEIKQELTLYGLFGPDPGSDKKVTVGGSNVTIKQWGVDKVTVNLPPPLAGDVVVTLRNHESNARPLTEWNAKLHYTADISIVNELPAGTLLQEATCSNAHIRADIHVYRENPGNAPVTHPSPLPFVIARDSHCEWWFHGSGTHGDVTATLSGGPGTLPLADPNTSGSSAYIVVTGEIDLNARTIRLVPSPITPVSLPTGFYPWAIGQITASSGGGSFTTQIPFTPAVFTQAPTLVLSPSFGITAGFLAETVPGPGIPIELKWDPVPAGFAPNTVQTPARETPSASDSASVETD